jgi:hypothetical protein
VLAPHANAVRIEEDFVKKRKSPLIFAAFLLDFVPRQVVTAGGRGSAA